MTVTVKGPKGELTRSFNPDIEIKVEENVINCILVHLNQKNTVQSMVQLVRYLLTWLKVYQKDFEKSLELDWCWLPCSKARK